MHFKSATFLETIFSSKDFNFEEQALELFRHQYHENKVYRRFCDLLNCRVQKVDSISKIPFLPISSFKNTEIKTGQFREEIIFTSSGTSGNSTSKHFVKEISIYEKSYRSAFERFYGKVEEYTILALLPAYLEREGSSLVFMVQDLIERSKKPISGFFLKNMNELSEKLQELATNQEKVLLIGVSFGLMDFADQYSTPINKNLIVMETGGMKGRRKEIIREELHNRLKDTFHTPTIHSEYGMTELLSQAYSVGNGVFDCPPWMKIILRKQDNPLEYSPDIITGGINIIDLANIHSCAFIATDDLGKKHAESKFEVLGRFDSADVRGCNLMVS